MIDNQILLIDKPAGISSFGVVARVRRLLTEQAKKTALERGETPPKRVKVGHTGTLDPFATGLLIILAGKATKRAGEFLKLDKEYIATLKLGAVSTTGDPEGTITPYDRNKSVITPSADNESSTTSHVGNENPITASVGNESATMLHAGNPAHPQKTTSNQTSNQTGHQTNPQIPTREAVENCVENFVGEIWQKVPAYSAVKINGQRAYKLARAGKEVATPTRKVQIYELEVLDYQWPELKIRCKVSSGTYIRTLAEDIGMALGVGAYLTALRRTQVGEYRIENAQSWEIE